MGLSLADTIKQCLRLGLKDPAAKLAREFKVCREGVVVTRRVCPACLPHVVQLCGRQHSCMPIALIPTLHATSPCCLPQMPDRQFLLLSAGVLAAAHDWPALQHMAGRIDRKSGLGMEHFIAAARWVEWEQLLRCLRGARAAWKFIMLV